MKTYSFASLLYNPASLFLLSTNDNTAYILLVARQNCGSSSRETTSSMIYIYGTDTTTTTGALD